MSKKDIPILTAEEMYTEDGFPSAKLLETHYRYMMQKYGPMEITHKGPSIVDVLAECGEDLSENIPKPD